MIPYKTQQLLLPNSYRIKITPKYFCTSTLTLDFKKIFIFTYNQNTIYKGNIWTRHSSQTIAEIILNKQFKLMSE